MHIITLITDLGHQDYYVGKLKGCLLSRINDATIVDICHDVELHDVSKAAHFAKASHSSFPYDSIHIINVYQHYSSNVRFLIAKMNDQYFVAPDNGIISLIFPEISIENIWRVHEHSEMTPFELIAHTCACISNGLIEEISDAAETITEKLSVQPVIGKSEIRGTIIHVDYMENVITNISKPLFEKVRAGRQFEIFFKHNDPITRISKSYADVHVGEALARFNDSDMLELSINMGKASSMYDLYKNETIQVYFL